MNRKGLSDVITTVLIILLVLAAVLIVWSFVRPTIESGGQQIQASADCAKLELVPTACTITQSATVMVQWKGGDVKLVKVKAVIEDSGQIKKASGTIPAPNFLETTTIGSIDVSGLTAPLKASVAGIITIADGSEQTCPISQKTISCTIDSGA